MQGFYSTTSPNLKFLIVTYCYITVLRGWGVWGLSLSLVYQFTPHLIRSFLIQAVYVLLTNKHGSTKDPPVKVETSVASDRGTILPERLSQLAQVIVRSTPMENLGLKYSVFGKVKEISLSSFLNRTLHPPSISPSPSPSPSQSPSPSPSPEGIYDTGPSMVPSYSPASSPNSHHSMPPSWGVPTSAPTLPSHPPISHPDQMPPTLLPYSPSRAPDKGLVSTVHVSSSSTYAYSCKLLLPHILPSA